MGMKAQLFVVFMVSVLAILPACWESKAPEKKSGLVVINVLDKELYEDCHIKGSINMPFESIGQCVDLVGKDAEIVVYCSNYMCATSEYASKKLQELGFRRVRIYEGGTAEWYQKGFPVEGPSTSSYLKRRVGKIIEDSHSKEQSIVSAHELAQKMGITSAHG